MSLRQTKKYDIVLDYIRSKSIKVRHRYLPSDINGTYDPDTKRISIARDIRGTVLGCAILFHELRHWLQHKDPRFGRFIRGYRRYHWRYMKEVVRCEQDAAKFAKKMMAGIGLKYKPPELDKEELPELIDYWRKEYFET